MTLYTGKKLFKYLNHNARGPQSENPHKIYYFGLIKTVIVVDTSLFLFFPHSHYQGYVEAGRNRNLYEYEGLFHSDGVIDYKIVQTWLKKSLGLDNKNCYLTSEVFTWLGKAHDPEAANTLYLVGRYLYKGIVGEKPRNIGKRLISKAAQNGNAQAKRMLAYENVQFNGKGSGNSSEVHFLDPNDVSFENPISQGSTQTLTLGNFPKKLQERVNELADQLTNTVHEGEDKRLAFVGDVENHIYFLNLASQLIAQTKTEENEETVTWTAWNDFAHGWYHTGLLSIDTVDDLNNFLLSHFKIEGEENIHKFCNDLFDYLDRACVNNFSLEGIDIPDIFKSFTPDCLRFMTAFMALCDD